MPRAPEPKKPKLLGMVKGNATSIFSQLEASHNENLTNSNCISYGDIAGLTSQRLKVDRSMVPSRMETVNGCRVARSYICWCLSIHAAVVPASTPSPSIAAVWIAVAPRLQSPPLARSRSLGVGPSRFDHKENYR